MNNRFDIIEGQLQRFIEENTARLFASIGEEIKLAHQLVEAMQEQLTEGKDGRMVAPGAYALYIHPPYAKDVRANTALLHSLAQHLKDSAEQNGIDFLTAPGISVIPDGAIPKGEFQIQAVSLEDTTGETKGITADHEVEQGVIPENAFLIVPGDKIVSLQENIINIGRTLDNQLVLEDARVSRRHAQLRAMNGFYMLFDLNSSGGTFVNGERITQAVLQPGDVISASGITMVYGEDAIRTMDETQEYRLASHETDTPNSETLISDD